MFEFGITHDFLMFTDSQKEQIMNSLDLGELKYQLKRDIAKSALKEPKIKT